MSIQDKSQLDHLWSRHISQIQMAASISQTLHHLWYRRQWWRRQRWYIWVNIKWNERRRWLLLGQKWKPAYLFTTASINRSLGSSGKMSSFTIEKTQHSCILSLFRYNCFLLLVGCHRQLDCCTVVVENERDASPRWRLDESLWWIGLIYFEELQDDYPEQTAEIHVTRWTIRSKQHYVSI
jgi:hypothetical protein